MPFAAPRTVVAEGARVGFSICLECGAAILLDPAESIDFEAHHEAWHEELRKWISSTRIAGIS